MEQSLGFGHFLQHADAISRTLLILMAIMSVGTWYVIVMKT
ncbi:MAG: MotA/TolQ/ExbB proton channel family protein, partial [Proteobacteria bacterium]